MKGLLGFEVIVWKTSIEGIPYFSYGWCLPNFLVENSDLVLWDYGMNEGNGSPGFGGVILSRHDLHVQVTHDYGIEKKGADNGYVATILPRRVIGRYIRGQKEEGVYLSNSNAVAGGSKLGGFEGMGFVGSAIGNPVTVLLVSQDEAY